MGSAPHFGLKIPRTWVLYLIVSQFASVYGSKGNPQFLLFMDTSCNFGFYEHQGMIRRQQYRCTVSLKGQTATMEFYLYDRSVVKEGNAPS